MKNYLSLGLLLSLFAGASWLYGQSTDVLVEQLKQQVQTAYQQEGRDKAVAIALLGHDYLAPDHPEMQRLLYEAYYQAPAYDEYYEYGVDETLFHCADWSPDGKTLAVGLTEGTIRLYDFSASGPPTFTSFRPISAIVLDIAYSPDGSKMAIGDAEGYTRVFDVATQQLLHAWQHTDYIRAVAWSPDGSRLAGAGDELKVFFYDPNSGEMLGGYEGHSDWIRGLSWSSDGTMVAAASDDGTATVWSADGDLITTHRDHTDYCRDVAFSPTGNQLITVSDDLSALLYDTGDSNTAERDLGGHQNWIMTLDWSPNGRRVVTADNGGGIVVHNLRSDSKETYEEYGEEVGWMDVDWAADNKTIAATTSSRILIYNADTQEKVFDIGVVGSSSESAGESSLDEILSEYLPQAQQIFPSPNGSKLALIDGEYNVQVIDLEAGQILYSIEDHTDWVRNVDWSKDGRLIATGSDDMMVGLWDANTGEMQHFMDGHTDWVRDVAFSPDGKVLVSAGDDGVIRSWDTQTGEALTVTDKIELYLMSVDWSPNQKFIATQDSEGYLRVFNANNNTVIFTSDVLTVIGTVRWQADNSLTVVAAEGGTLKWAAEEGLVPVGDDMATIAKAADGKEAKAIGFYISVTGGEKPAFLEGHKGNVTQLDWSPESNYLVSQDDRGYLIIWDVDQSEMVVRLSQSDGTPRNIVWAPGGDGFYVPGSPDRLLTDPAGLRQRLENSYIPSALSSADILYYDLDKIILQQDAVVQRLLASGDMGLLNAIAAFYEQRAASRMDADGKSNDEKMAAHFRTAAEQR